MPQLTINKLYQDGQVLTEAQLDAAMNSIETFINVVGLGPDNIQDNSIGAAEIQTASVTESKLATDSVTTVKILDQAVTQAKLATALQNLLVPSATVSAYMADTAPVGWLLCDGVAYSRTTYASLFALVGVRFGSGDGTTTFNVPDLRGRFLRGVDAGSNRDPDAASRTAMNTGGATGNNLGTVQDDAMLAHTHSYLIATGGQFPSTSAQTGTPNAGSYNTSSAGSSTETRPKNASVQYIIKY